MTATKRTQIRKIYGLLLERKQLHQTERTEF